MISEVLGKCPVCGGTTEVTAIACIQCGTRIEGHFSLCRFCNLTQEQKNFIEIFIKCRGNIKDVEKELGVSYPTVRNRLEDVAAALGYSGAQDNILDFEISEYTKDVLHRLESGSISVDEALELLRK